MATDSSSEIAICRSASIARCARCIFVSRSTRHSSSSRGRSPKSTCGNYSRISSTVRRRSQWCRPDCSRKSSMAYIAFGFGREGASPSAAPSFLGSKISTAVSNARCNDETYTFEGLGMSSDLREESKRKERNKND